MVEVLQEFEGTWDELSKHAEEFSGRRLRLTVLPEPVAKASAEGLSIEEMIARIASEIPEEEWKKLPPDLTDNLDHYIYGTPRE